VTAVSSCMEELNNDEKSSDILPDWECFCGTHYLKVEVRDGRQLCLNFGMA
jgi:hypothetical protein